MLSPFPGMDPFLERPATCPDVHNALIAELRRGIGPLVDPHYYVRIEERTYLDPEGLLLVGVPDVSVQRTSGDDPRPIAAQRHAGQRALAVEVPVPEEVRETWLQVHRAEGGEIVTVIEILSPGNKRRGPGQDVYLQKRMAVLGTRTHLVEIDLLRAGEPMTVHGDRTASDYRILVSRGDRRPRAELFAFSVRDTLPEFTLPLLGGCAEPEIGLRRMLDVVYETGGYHRSIDYLSAPVPPLAPADATWADEVLRAAGRR